MNVRISLAAPQFLIAAAATAALVACSSSPQSNELSARESTGRAASAVIKGKDSDKSQDAVVLLVHFDPSTGVFGQCTGSLLAPNVVLTARHCVADTDESAACDVTGTPLAQGAVRGNHKPDTLYVFTGPNRPDFGNRDVKPDGQGAKILDDGGKNLCNHDIAMVILKDPVPNAKLAKIRLDGPVLKTDVLTAIGWGVTDKTDQPATRQQRTGITILGVGPDDSTLLAVPPNEFQVGESICSGDSGGPALAPSGAIVGVVSRGGNATKPDPNNPASSCINGENLYTKVAPFKDFIEGGLKLVDAEPWLENGPDPRLLKPGAACGDASECRSSLCVTDPSQSNATTCAQDCSADPTVCPEGQTCVADGSAQVCRAPAPPEKKTTATTTTGCSTGPGSHGSSNGMIGLALAALGLVAFRRRRA
jgi:MYXO-CTERM domain-containing protein